MERRDPAPVKMPKRVTFKHGSKGTRYVYLTVRAYRNDRGMPTSDEVAIGKVAPDGVSLIPNQRYHEMFDTESSVYQRPQSSVAFGDAAALSLLAKRLMVTEILNESAGHLAASVLLAAIHMATIGNVMCHIDTFCQESWTPDGLHLDSQRTSELFAALGFNERADFLRRWIALRQEDEYIAYDVTSLSAYSGGVEDAEWGHNRDDEALCQINLGMFLGKKTRLPVYYETYQGSILDKVHLPRMMASAKALGIKKVRFVFDRGFVTKDNLIYVATEHLSLVSALPVSRSDARALISQALPSIRSSENLIGTTGLYAGCYPIETDGFKAYAYVFFSPYKAAVEEEIIYAKITNLENELTKLARSTKRIARRYRAYFDVTLSSGAISFKRDFAKIDSELARVGYFILITNDPELDSANILAIYREKDAIEKAFSGMKNHLEFKRMRTHSTLTTDGKLFTGFISLILRSCVRQSLSARLETASMSVGTALRELHKLKRITYSDGSVVHTAVSKTQREILCSLGISIDALLATV